jgi:hypothetical protein
MIGPPEGVSPARLFRLLLRRPRPWLAIDLSVAGHSVGFSVQALSVAEVGDVLDAVEDGRPEMRSDIVSTELAARCLRLNGEPCFENAAAMRSVLESDEAERVIEAVGMALATIGPRFPPCSFDRWLHHVKEGASHHENIMRAHMLAGCVDSGWRTEASRPERFFDVRTPDELTDGQWLAFRAAREATTKKT